MSENGDEDTGDTSWSQYRRLVIIELKRHNDEIERLGTKHDEAVGRIEQKLDELRLDFATVKVKVALVGMVIGVAISTLVNYIIAQFRNGH